MCARCKNNLRGSILLKAYLKYVCNINPNAFAGSLDKLCPAYERFVLIRIKPNEIAMRLIQVIAAEISIGHMTTIMIIMGDGFCGVIEEEILAIAEHEQMPGIAAIAYGQYLF